jgi:hypothetical protein
MSSRGNSPIPDLTREIRIITKGDAEAVRQLYPYEDTARNPDERANLKSPYGCDGCDEVCAQTNDNGNKLTLIRLSQLVVYATIVLIARTLITVRIAL